MQTIQFARREAPENALRWLRNLTALLLKPLFLATHSCLRADLSRLRRSAVATMAIVSAMGAGNWTAWADAPPVLIPPPNTTILEDSGRTNLTFTVTDADTPFFSVTVTARSSNTNLVPLSNLFIVGSGTTRDVGITTKTNASGSATISLIASDGTSTTTNSFLLTVTGVNDAPALTPLTNMTVLEDAAPVKRTVIVTDTDTPISLVLLTAVSSNTNLVRPTLTGSTTNRTLTLTLVSNQVGTATITLVANDGSLTDTNSFDLTVTPVNDAPFMAPLTAFTMLEDRPTNRTVIVTDVDTAISSVTVTAESLNTNVATASISGTDTNRTLTLTPVSDAVGTSTIRLIADDGDKKSTNTFVLTVADVNDKPSFGIVTNLITLSEDSPLYSVTNFATNIRTGPTNEGTQTKSFVITSTNAAFFAVQPSMTSTGLFSFRLATNVFGTNTLSLVMLDSGGTNNGGLNRSDPQTLTIVATPVNDAPFIATNAALVIREDAGSTNVTVTVTDPDTTISVVTLTASISDTNLATVATSGSTTNRTLTITTVTNSNGAATITLIADDGALTRTNTFALTVTPVNDRPTFTLTTNRIVLVEDSGDFSLSNLATNISSGPSDESSQTNSFVLTVTNAAFYAVQPAISPAGTLTFRSATNASGTNTITVVLRDSGPVTNGGLNVSLSTPLSIVVTPVNDAPVISGLSAFAINEDAGTTNKTFVVTDVDNPMTNITVTAFSSDTNIVTVALSGTATSTNRTLAITTRTNANGTPTITVIASDGSASSTNAFVLTVNPVNDAPVLSSLTNLTVLEDSAAVNRTVVVTDVDNDIATVTVTATSSATNVATVSVSGSTTNRTLAVTPSTNGVGTTTITFVADDGAKTATNSFVLTVTPVNDAPDFTLSTNNVVINEDSGAQNMASFLTGISSGPSDESAQTNFFVVTVADPSFFSTQPAISPVGTLTFLTATNANGTNAISVVMWDNGGTNNGGINHSSTQTFNIVATGVNDAPIISGLSSFSINEDVVTNVTFTVSDVDTAIASVTVTVTSSDTNLVTVGTTGTSTNRTLDITPTSDLSGVTTLTLVASDGSASTTNTLVLTINSVNDAPSFTLTTNLITVAEDSAAFTLTNVVTNLLAGPSNETNQSLQFVLTVTNTDFFSTQPAISTNGTITFQTAANAWGTNVIQVQLQDNGGTNNSGVDTSAAQVLTIVATGLNDPPVLSSLATTLTINEDAGQTNLLFLVQDIDTDIATVTVSATSSDTNVVTVLVTGSDTNRTLTITTVTNANGPVTITVVADDGTATATNTLALTVTSVNDLPVMAPAADVSVNENATPYGFILALHDADDPITNVVVTASSSDTNLVTASITGSNTNRNVSLVFGANKAGTATVTLVANDGTDTTTNQFGVTVTLVNQAPTFTLSTNLITLTEDPGAQTLTSFLTSVSSGPANESDQTNYFVVTTTNTSFFSVQPAVSTNGTLTFTVAANAYGTNQITIVLHDNGGTTNGGTDVSTNAAVDLVVTPVNDPPAFVSGISNFSVREDSGVTSHAFVVVDVDSPITNVTVTATSSDTNLVAVGVSGTSTNRTLDVTTVTNMFGSATITVVASDGTDSITNDITLTVTSVNDQPSFTLTTNQVTVAEDSGSFSLANLATNLVVGPSNESAQTNFFILVVTNTAMFSVQPAISPAGTLTFTPATNAYGTNNIQVYMRDSGGATNGGVNTSIARSLQIAVSSVNDAPIISGISAFSIVEDSGLTNKLFNVADPDTALSSVTVTATSSDTNVVTVAVTGSGSSRTLAVTTVTNGFGTPQITLVADDGSATSTNTFTVTVTAVNDAPTLGVLTNLTVLEDSGATARSVSVDDVDTALSSVTLTAGSSDTGVATVLISGTGTNRTLTVTPVANMFGTSTITYWASDGSLAVTNSFVLTVSSVNDAPSFTLSTNKLVVLEDAGLMSVANFATNISVGPANESSQTNYFVVTAADTTFFTNQPAISTNGTLTFRTKTNISGTNVITVLIRDNGGTNNSGINESAPQTFNLVISNVNDAPVLSSIANFTIREDLGTTNKTFTVTDVDTDLTNVVVTATSSDPSLVSLSVTGTSTNRTLGITTLTNANGTATITLVANDGTDTTTNSFALTVTAVNDAPAFTLSTTNVTVSKYASLITMSNFVTGISSGPADESAQVLTFVVTAGNTNSFTVQPAISTNGTLTFQAKDVAGVASVSVRLQDDGGTANGGSNTTPSKTFTITVPANPFVALAGKFNGLFYETNGVITASAGFMSFTLATNGNYSGYVLLAGGSNSMSGQFQVSGATTNTITRTNGDLTVAMTLDLTTNFTESATGTVASSNWTAVVTVDRASFNLSNNPTYLAGEYNLALPASSDPTEPEGFSYGLVSVDADGTVALDGNLSDGTVISQTTQMSHDGVWPLYSSLYNGHGVVLGWVTFGRTAVTNDLAGAVSWVKQAGVDALYNAGFTNDITATGSTYVEPQIGTRALNLTSGTIVLSGGDLIAPVNTTFTLNTDQTVTIDPLDPNGVTLSIDVTNGTFSGSFTHPDLGTVNVFNGVLLQTSTNALGYFLTTDKCGAVILH